MATSSVPGYMAAFLTQLQARPGLTKVQLSYGVPRGSMQNELVMLYLRVEGDQEWAALGQRGREETFSHPILISVLGSPGEHQKVAERAYTIAAEIEAQLRADPTVNATVRVAQVGGPFALTLAASPTNQGIEAALTMTVEASARI